MQKPQSSLQKSRTIGNYIITKNLGEGTFGKVKLGVHSVTGQKVAIKILQKSKIIDVADVQRVTRQIHILKQIRHPNLIQLYQIIQTPKQLFLVMEYVSEGQLFEHIVKKKKLKENQACQFFRQIIEGVQYLHQLGVVHRDLKPENLLIDFNRRLKIVDFGLSNTYKNKELLKTACGSPCYAAPEMIAGKKYQGLNADIWSCGVILFAMICGYLPFEDPNTATLYKKITAGDYTIPKFVSPFARQLLQRLLTTDPERRIKMGEIKKHAWYRQPIDLDFNLVRGIKMGVNSIPIDEDVLSEVISSCPDQGYEQSRKFITNNRHNHGTTIYYLLLKRNLRNGICSKFDICSPTFQLNLLQRRSSPLENSNPQKVNQDLEQIELDRLTTATGPRAFRAFSRGTSNRASNASQSPDITVHNFCLNKNKPKLKKGESEQACTMDVDSSNFSNMMDSLNNQPTNQRRKIYFQAQTKSILTNSIDLKTLRTINNPEIKTERAFQKTDKGTERSDRMTERSDRMTERSDRMMERLEKPSLDISLYDVDEKKEALNRFFHQQRKNSHSIRQPVTFRTSINRTNKVMSQNKKYQDQQSFRQSLATRDGYTTDRYMSLDMNQYQQNERTKRSNSKQPNPVDYMNRTFVAGTNNKVPKIFGFKVENQSQRIKSILNSTITTGFSKRRTTTRQKYSDERNKLQY